MLEIMFSYISYVQLGQNGEATGCSVGVASRSPIKDAGFANYQFVAASDDADGGKDRSWVASGGGSRGRGGGGF